MAFNRYLGKAEKDNFAQFVALMASVENVLEKLKDVPSTDKEYLKYLRSGRTWLEKAINLRIENLDTDAALDFQKHITRTEPVVFCPSDRAKKEFKELEQMKSHLHISMDDFQDLYCFVIEATCKHCTETNYKRCPAYNILLKHDIVVVSPEGERCPYSYVDNDEALEQLDKMREYRMAQNNLEVLDRAEKKLKELIQERDAVKEESLQKDIDLCKKDGAIERLKGEVEKLNKALGESEERMKRANARWVEKDKEAKDAVAAKERIEETIKFLREVQRKERARIMRAVNSAVDALYTVSKKGVAENE